MSIVKRNYCRESIEKLYLFGGAEYVINSMKKVEAFFCEDEFSLETVKILNTRNEEKLKEHLDNAFRVVS